MNKLIASAIVAAGVAMPALAQNYTYEFRIIADGDAGAPTGAWTQMPLTNTATQIGFWIQARVSQDSGENWGIGRFTAPGLPNSDFVIINDPSSASMLNRGRINSTGTAQFGRGVGFRNGGAAATVSQNTASGNNGNNVGAGTDPLLMPSAFPGVTNAENGAFDNGNDRIYGMDAYVGGIRNSPRFQTEGADTPGDTSDDVFEDVVDPNTNFPVNPWNRQGAGGPSTLSPTAPAFTPFPNNAFSTWANLYRFVVIMDPLSGNVERTVILTASGQLSGTVLAAPSAPGSNQWAMQLAPGVQVSHDYSFVWGVPTPGAATLLGLGGLVMARRRRA